MLSKLVLAVGVFAGSLSMAYYQNGRVVPQFCGKNEVTVYGAKSSIGQVCQVSIQGTNYNTRLLTFETKTGNQTKTYVYNVSEVESLPITMNSLGSPRYTSAKLGLQLIGESINGQFQQYYYVVAPAKTFFNATLDLKNNSVAALSGSFQNGTTKPVVVLVKKFEVLMVAM